MKNARATSIRAALKIMKLPLFDPQTIPNRRLSEIHSAQSLPLLTRDALRRALSSNSAELLHRDVSIIDKPRHAAVLIILVDNGADFDVVLTVRAKNLRHHGGQISFVGGAQEPDELPLAAALREAHEEIGLSPVGLDIMGELPVYHTITGFAITPIVACLSAADWQRQSLQLDAREVDHLFTVPLSVLTNHDLICVHDYRWQNNQRQYYSVTHEDYFIWGASMAMMRNLDILLRQ